MSTQNQPEPQGGSGTARRVRAVADGISTTLNVVGTVLILGLVILVNADVIGRNLFLAAIVFLQVSQAFRMGRFTRTEALLDGLARHSPRLRNAVELIYVVAAFVLIWLLFSASDELFWKAWDRNSYIGTVGDFTAPDWPVKLVILIGCLALMMQMVITGIIALWGVIDPTPAGETGP
jgi:TRAP-type mannitol/chloroaromatic compound transport system permease small subunit